MTTIASPIAATAKASGVDNAQLKAVAKQFEAVFARQLIGSMRAGKLGDDILGSDASDQFRDMADSRTADSLADKGAFGIADLLVKQFGAKDASAKAGTK